MRNASAPVDRSADGPGWQEVYPGTAIELTVPGDIDFADCDEGKFQSWNGRYHQGPGQRDLVWAIDVAGPLLIIDAASFPGTSASDQAELASVLDSITISKPTQISPGS
ncbi:MAG TPA: hypothetical protein VF071_06745 [Candidatus Limnocylindria bacterium]